MLITFGVAIVQNVALGALIASVACGIIIGNCTLLSYMINFSSPVIIRFKNGSISFRFSRDSQMETRPMKFFTGNSCGTQLSSFFWYPVLCKWFKTVLWSMFGSVAMSQDKICRSTSILRI